MNQQVPFLEELKEELMEHAPQAVSLSRPPRRGFRLSGAWVAAAVFVVTLLLGGLTWILASGGSPPPVADAPALLGSFSSGDVVYEFRTYSNSQGPEAPCVGIEFDLETGGRRATVTCPTEVSEEFEYASHVHASPWTFVVGYGLGDSETIEVDDAIRVITTEQVNGRRFFLIQFGQPVDESFQVPVTRPDGTTRFLTVVSPDNLPPVTTTSTVDPEELGAPSQSPADAARDGIVPALAELSLADRVSIVVSEPTSQGVWAISEIPDTTQAPGCVIGDRNGLYGTDFICVSEYREVVLLNDDLSQIMRAYPLPSQPARLLLVTDEAVYCAHQGDGGLPDSMLCRIDRQSLDITGRIFPYREESDYGPPDGNAIPYGDWTIAPVSPVVVMERLDYDGRIVTTGYDGIAYHDPLTLERLDVDLADPTP